MIVKYYNLKRWDKTNHWDWILTFNKIDWAYAQWIDEKWELVIWHSYEYELKDWIYYPTK
jgi:hypothetical protein